MLLSYKHINIAAMLWLSLGIIVFLVGWCAWYISIPLCLSVLYILYKYLVNHDSQNHLSISWFQIVIAVIMISLILILCGIGGYVVQPNDHFGRNAIFADIVHYDWPVYNAEQNMYMCYYLAFWMVPALFGKLFHSIDIAHFAQLVWMTIGMTLLWFEICIYIGKVKLGTLLIFYFFAGWKVVECLLYYPFFGGDTIRNTILTLSTNGSPGVFHAGPIVQLLHDPFNQTIPLFLAMMLILNNSKSAYIGFIYSLLLLYAPFPFIGFAPIVIYLFIKNIQHNSLAKLIKSLFSYENICALSIILVCGLFFLSNINGSHKGLRPINNMTADIWSFLLYIIFEFGLFIIIGYETIKDKLLMWIALGSVCIFGWFQVGLHNDFCFRTNMPLIFLLCISVIKRFYTPETSKLLKKVIIIILLIGGLPAHIHSCLRYLSTYYVYMGKDQVELNNFQSFYDVKQMYIMQQKSTRDDTLPSVFNSGQWEWMTQSFKGSPNSFFFKYIAK